MRHGVKDNHLGRTVAHRRALLANLAIALIQHKRIKTTLAKAKALRKYAEPLFTKSRHDTTHSRRTVFSYLQNKIAVKELFSVISPKIMERPGGYTRILKLGPRFGDNAEMAMIELVDFNEYYTGDKKKSRARRAAKPTVTAKNVSAPAVAAPAVSPVMDPLPVADSIVEEMTESAATEIPVADSSQSASAVDGAMNPEDSSEANAKDETNS